MTKNIVKLRKKNINYLLENNIKYKFKKLKIIKKIKKHSKIKQKL